MKKLSLFLLLGSFVFSAYAQDAKPKGQMLSVSYFAPLFFQQHGVKVSIDIPLTELKGNFLSFRPQLTWFMQPELHQNFILGGDLAYTVRNPEKYFYVAPAVGVSYLLSIENTEGSVNLGTGEVSQKRETLHYFLPTFSLEIGKLPKNRFGYFSRGFWGRKMTGQEANAAFFGLEFGGSYTFKKK